jgi:hypothetical protein
MLDDLGVVERDDVAGEVEVDPPRLIDMADTDERPGTASYEPASVQRRQSDLWALP